MNLLNLKFCQHMHSCTSCRKARLCHASGLAWLKLGPNCRTQKPVRFSEGKLPIQSPNLTGVKVQECTSCLLEIVIGGEVQRE